MPGCGRHSRDCRQMGFLPANPVVAVQQHQGIVYDDSTDADHAKQGYGREVPTQHPVGENRSGECHWDADHGDNGLPVAAQKARHDPVHHDQDDWNEHAQGVVHCCLGPSALIGIDLDARVLRDEIRHHILVHQGSGLNWRDCRRVGTGAQQRGLIAVDSRPRGEIAPFGNARHRGQRHFAASGTLDAFGRQLA